MKMRVKQSYHPPSPVTTYEWSANADPAYLARKVERANWKPRTRATAKVRRRKVRK